MPRQHRKTTPGVRGGRPLRKNRTDRSRHYRNYHQDRPIVDRLRPGNGYRHVLLKRDVQRFLRILPDWEKLSEGLDAVLLAGGEYNLLGWHRRGIVAVCAWERDHDGYCSHAFGEEHRHIFDRLGVFYLDLGDHYLVEWTDRQIKGFQLMSVLLHELGHHHDRMTTRSRRRPARGEYFANMYANTYADRLWDRYFEEFGD